MINSNKSMKTRNIKRVIYSIIAVAVIGALVFFLFFRNEGPPKVTVSKLAVGDIASKIYVKAQILPGSIVEQTVKQKQRVVSVYVKPGDQVSKGDILITLDRSELLAQYESARKARLDIEAANAAKKKIADAQALQAKKDQKEFELQAAKLTGALTRIVTNITLLVTTPSSSIDIQDDISEKLTEIISGYDPNTQSIEQLVQELLGAVTQSVDVTQNPQYQAILKNIQNDVAILNATLPVVLTKVGGSLTSGLTSGLNLTSDLTSQISQLGLNVTDPLASAKELESSYKKIYEASSDSIRAEISGIITEVNTTAGSYIGTDTSQANNSLNSLISGAIGDLLQSASLGQSSSAKPTIIIYDNLKPKAAFQVGQFDSARLEKGMSVDYSLNNKNYHGNITYKPRFVAVSTSGTGGASSLLEQAGIVSLTDQEPKLTIEMSIEGTNLSDLVPGFLIDAEIKTAFAAKVILLPAGAMRRELDEYYVFVTDQDNRLVKKNFVPGIQSDMYVQVVSGLTVNDNVVQNPTNTMAEGQKVRLEEGT
ncbi:MAG: efflux RND transporter periplasmic adaptor subunit [Saccharofermentanales bacterium]